MKAIEELNTLSINLHIIFIFFTIFIIARVIKLLSSDLEYAKFIKIYERWILFFRATLFAIIFSGIVVMATNHFNVRWQVWLMAILALYLLVATIKEAVVYRYSDQKINFLKSIKKRYIIDLFLIILVVIVSQSSAISI